MNVTVSGAAGVGDGGGGDGAAAWLAGAASGGGAVLAPVLLPDLEPTATPTIRRSRNTPPRMRRMFLTRCRFFGGGGGPPQAAPTRRKGGRAALAAGGSRSAARSLTGSSVSGLCYGGRTGNAGGWLAWPDRNGVEEWTGLASLLPFGDDHPVGIILLVGGILGVFAGWAWKLAHRHWQDWHRAKDTVRTQRRLFFSTGGRGVLWAIGLLILAVVMLHL